MGSMLYIKGITAKSGTTTKKIILFSLDFKTMLTKHELTQFLSSDLKKTPVYFNWNFLIYWPPSLTLKILRELGRGDNDVKDSLA